MKKIKSIITAIGIIAFILAWGVIGSMEGNYMGNTDGAILCSIFLAISVLCYYVSGLITKEIKHNRQLFRQMQNDYCNYIMR